MYGVSADELHKMVVDDLRGWCKHFCPPMEELLADEQNIPLWQTIRRILSRVKLERHIAVKLYAKARRIGIDEAAENVRDARMNREEAASEKE